MTKNETDRTPQEAASELSTHDTAASEWPKSKVLLEPKEKFRITDAMRDLVTVVVATLNEKEAIGPLIDEIVAAGYKKILVVDGYSNDGTVEIAKTKGALVVGQHGKGKSGAVLVARDTVDTPFFLLMDGDYSYDPKDIDKFTAHANRYDHIIGYRQSGRENISSTHKLGNWVLTKSFNLLMGSNIPDITCGMYLMRTRKMRGLLFDIHGFEIDLEIAAQMLVDGRVTYVPINYRRRLGTPKSPTWRQGFRALFAAASLGRRYNPVVLFGFVAAVALIPAIVILGLASYLVLFFGQYHTGLFLTSMMLFVIGGQGLAVATVGFMLRRLERKLNIVITSAGETEES